SRQILYTDSTTLPICTRIISGRFIRVARDGCSLWLGHDGFFNDFLGLFLPIDRDLFDGALALARHAFFDHALFALGQVFIIDVVRLGIEIFGDVEFFRLDAVDDDLGSRSELFIYPWGDTVVGIDFNTALLQYIADGLGCDAGVGDLATVFDGD